MGHGKGQNRTLVLHLHPQLLNLREAIVDQGAQGTTRLRLREARVCELEIPAQQQAWPLVSSGGTIQARRGISRTALVDANRSFGPELQRAYLPHVLQAHPAVESELVRSADQHLVKLR